VFSQIYHFYNYWQEKYRGFSKYYQDSNTIKYVVVFQRFKKEVIKEELGMDMVRMSPSVLKFIHKGAELLWYMCIHDPPMYILSTTITLTQINISFTNRKIKAERWRFPCGQPFISKKKDNLLLKDLQKVTEMTNIISCVFVNSPQLLFSLYNILAVLIFGSNCVVMLKQCEW
jgi:hypothetical protein